MNKLFLFIGIMLISYLRSDASSAAGGRGISVSFSLSSGVVSVSITNESCDGLTYFLPKSSRDEVPYFLSVKVKDSNNVVVSKRDGCDDGYWSPLILSSNLIIPPLGNQNTIPPGSTETISVPIDVMLRGQGQDVIRGVQSNKYMFRYVIYFDDAMHEWSIYESDWFSLDAIKTTDGGSSSPR
ncbi:MAG: hypothetical protein WC360_09505 [Opitutales bacterium]